MHTLWLSLIIAINVFALPASAASGFSQERWAGELWEMEQWVAANFLDTAETEAPQAILTVLANNDPVQKNARLGRPLRIADRMFWQGLFCHAYSKVLVRLPSGATKFEATVGLDSNEQTVGGRGSVMFSVSVAGKEFFCSSLLREGMAGVPVSTDLGGTREFVMEVHDAGDGIACDQADWAEARVTLTDGTVVWLGDMAMNDPHRPAHDAELPFSFTYADRPSTRALGSWPLQRGNRKLDDNHTEHTLTYSDPETGLVFRCVAIQYHDFPAVEWTLYFKNTGSSDTPVLEDIQPLNTLLRRYRWPEREPTEFVLHHFTGSPCTPRDYEPHRMRLDPKADKIVAAAGGRPTNSDLCYFNIEWPSRGVIIGIGWPGQWAARFTRDDTESLRVRVGQELTHFKLHPGEEVRTPLIAIMFWSGDWVHGQNVWRRWMMAHNLPRPGGRLPPCPQLAACSSHQFGEMIHANEENQKLFIDRYLEEGLRLDYWWMDAGWYVNETGWPNTGTWEVDRERFPRGLRAITDHAHEKGVKSIVWFEPERVTPGTWLYKNHPEWLLGPEGATKLLNLGNLQARRWLTEHVDRLIAVEGIDLYRNDFNIDPLPYWRANDAEDRQGITEINYVSGYLSYWDELRCRHPDMLIDSCASGGRRNDLETLRRAVPLLRSDYIFEPVGNQCHTYGIAFWMPFYGTGTISYDPYHFCSVMCPHFTACWDVRRKDLDYDAIRRLVAGWKKVAPYFMGDYYPLTNYSLEKDVWIGWQFDRPDLGQGMVQLFRRAESIYESARLALRGLDPDSSYTVSDLDSQSSDRLSGRELMEKGLPVSIPDRPGASIVTYRKVTVKQ